MPILLTFTFALIALLCWIFAMWGDSAARKIFVFGLVAVIIADLLGSLVGLLSPALSIGSGWWTIIKLVLLAPIIEEGVKAGAARSRAKPREIFALVSLFGIFELMLSKPLAMIGAQLWSDAFIALPALAMHLLTAAIYAYRFKGHIFVQLLVCVIIHAAFNAAVYWLL